jgi:methyl-accepting chemotaxis protein
MKDLNAVTEIARASSEQSVGIDQVNTAVSQIDVVTQSNAAKTEEIAGTARKLAADAQLLMRAAGHFLLPEQGALHEPRRVA